VALKRIISNDRCKLGVIMATGIEKFRGMFIPKNGGEKKADSGSREGFLVRVTSKKDTVRKKKKKKKKINKKNIKNKKK